MEIKYVFILCLIVLIFIFGLFLFFIFSRKNKLNSNKNETKPEVITARTTWFSKVKKTVAIGEFGFFEEFKNFPFLTDFNNTKEFLIKNKISFKAIESFIKEMNEIQNKFFMSFRKKQKQLFEIFKKLESENQQEKKSIFERYYFKSLNSFVLLISVKFVNSILVKKINFLLGENYFNESKITSELIKNFEDSWNVLFKDLSKNFENNKNQKSGFEKSFKNNNSKYLDELNEFDDDAWAYNTLGANVEENFSDIKKKYYKLSKKYHPDSNNYYSDAKKMIDLNLAFNYIKQIKQKNEAN